MDSLFGSYIRNMGLVVYMYSVLFDFNNISIVFDLFDLCKFVELVKSVSFNVASLVDMFDFF